MRIPIKAAKKIADDYDWDQVIIIARKVGPHGGEHVTTYGKSKLHCQVAAKIGNFFKYNLMGWPEPPPPVSLTVEFAIPPQPGVDVIPANDEVKDNSNG